MSIHRLKSIGLLVLGIGLIGLLIYQTDLKALFNALGTISLFQLSLLLLLQLLTIALILKQWSNLFKLRQIPLSFKTLLDTHFYGVFFESVTPALKTGGEVFKVYYLHIQGVSKPVSSAVIVIQKALSMIAFITISFISFGLFMRYAQTNLNQSLKMLFVGFGLMLIVFGLLLYGLNKRGKFQSFYQELAFFKSQKITLLKQLPLAFAIWLLFGIKMLLLLSFLNIDATFIFGLGLTFITYMVGMVPLTPGGLGTVEMTFVLMLSTINISLTMALAIALIFRFVTYWFVFLISILYIALSKLKGKRRLAYER